MTYPTAEEIREAHEAIIKAGPVSPETVALASLCLTDPVLTNIIENIGGVTFSTKNTRDDLMARSKIMAALMSGLNIMLRIHELRTKPTGWKQ